MKLQSQCLLLALVLSVFAGGLFFRTGLSEGYPNEEGGKIGLVNLQKIFVEYRKVKEMRQNLNREMEEELATMKQIEEECKGLQEEIPLFRPGSKVRREKEQRLAEKLFEIKHKEDRAKYFFSEKTRMSIEKIYQDITEEVEQYARDNKYSMVIRVADADFFGARSEEALRLQINTRDVIYWKSNDEITDIILERMNQRYEREKSSLKKDGK